MLETLGTSAYGSSMTAASDGFPPQHPWRDVLSRARADMAADRTHDLDDVLRDLDADAVAIETEDKLPESRVGR